MKIENFDRLLLECELEPVQGTRFQPTGFPSLGAAEFSSFKNDKLVRMVLLESAQSMANRLEAVCLDDSNTVLSDTLEGLPFITVIDEQGNTLTNSIKEAHRMNSSYMLSGDDQTLSDRIKSELGIDGKDGEIDIPRFAKFVFQVDTNSILHGVFIARSEIAGGRYKLARSLSAFIEAEDIQPAVSGGVKLDHLDPSGGEMGSKEGAGHIPFSRTEYTAKSIKAYFSIDISLIKSYQLDDAANDLLFTFALWKIQAFLSRGLRLRTACDLSIKGALTSRQTDFNIPDLDTLDRDLRSCIKKCMDKKIFTDKPVKVSYKRKKK